MKLLRIGIIIIELHGSQSYAGLSLLFTNINQIIKKKWVSLANLNFLKLLLWASSLAYALSGIMSWLFKVKINLLEMHPDQPR